MSSRPSTSSTSAAAAGGSSWATFLLRPLAPSIAQTRFKANVFGLFLLWFFESLFTPYRTLRSAFIWFMDEKVQGRLGPQTSWAGAGVSTTETLLALILLWNIVEAGLALRYPTAQKFVPSGMQITPAKISSPLTRAYTPSSTTSTPLPSSTAIANAAIQRLSTPSNSTSTPPSRLSASSLARTSSPLSASTAKILNLPNRETNSSPNKSSGLFFNPDDTASPSKIAQSQNGTLKQSNAPAPARPAGGATGGSATTSDGEFVLVDRAEREWAENVWKGVRGKGGKIGI